MPPPADGLHGGLRKECGKRFLRPRAGVQSQGMTTFAPHVEAALQEREREAWGRYSATLRDLEGRDYDDAETEAWAELQRDLRAIEAERVNN
jgi:hypothetical protein